ncbi:TRAP transporter large permease subunit [Alkalihalobacterium alkalinitrilicum]|uniref:TRAP transporter large permease subunit n=1 Tax=Alkalihalobacterium alkalinitrilicum TaxID=427920 RepID=UPI001C55F2A0|nr:TRAP transporter large permease subunit [Alkalihalobacterium alkalinitrilicum]
MIDLGVTPMAAHMFVLFFATVSNFTPPIALACFAAAPIARDNPHKIGFAATKLGIMGYVLPFIFVYNSAILLGTSPEAGMMDVVISILYVIIGINILSVAVAAYLFKDLSWMKRAILTILSAVIMVSINSEAGWLINTVACILALAVFMQEWLAKRKVSDRDTESQKQAYDIG